MDYGKYKNARNAAWQCILDYDIKTLPIEVTNIVRKSNDINLVKTAMLIFFKTMQAVLQL